MRITNVKSTMYLTTLVEAMKNLMIENNVTEISLEGTIFNKNANWTSLIIEDNKLKYKGPYGAFEVINIHRWDIVNLQKIIYDKMEKLFVEEI
jgi:hypothetical protein